VRRAARAPDARRDSCSAVRGGAPTGPREVAAGFDDRRQLPGAGRFFNGTELASGAPYRPQLVPHTGRGSSRPMPKTYSRILLALALACSAALARGAAPTVLATGRPTLDLSIGTSLDAGTPQNIAYDAAANQYYGATGGSTQDSGYVWNASGNLVQTFAPIGVDVRAVAIDPASDSLLAVTFDARTPGGPGALVALPRDASGQYATGSAATVLATMPGLSDAQSSPAFDPGAGTFYSIGSTSTSTSGIVNVVSGIDGSLAGRITLDLSAAGQPALLGEFIGYDTAAQALVILDAARARALVFSARDGSFLGASGLPGIVSDPLAPGFGYANGQLFVYDAGLRGYRGFDVLAAPAVPEPGTWALMAAGGVLALASRVRRGRLTPRRDPSIPPRAWRAPDAVACW
jgi:PEP-CTERM motif